MAEISEEELAELRALLPHPFEDWMLSWGTCFERYDYGKEGFLLTSADIEGGYYEDVLIGQTLGEARQYLERLARAEKAKWEEVVREVDREYCSKERKTAMKQKILDLLDELHASPGSEPGYADCLGDLRRSVNELDFVEHLTGYTAEVVKKAWEDVEFVVHYHSCPLGASEWEKARLGLGILNTIIQAITKEVLE